MQFFEISFNAGASQRLGTANIPEGLLAAIHGKQVICLVHGINNEPHEARDAYEAVEAQLEGEYDLSIRLFWPGGNTGIDYFGAKSRSNGAAALLRPLLGLLAERAAALDVMGHSMGNRVLFKALKGISGKKVVRNFWSMAAAVDNESLEPGEEFHSVFSAVERLVVYHSARDGVLSLAYRAAEFDRALGLSGPEDSKFAARHKQLFVANCKHVVASHGAYKHSMQVFQHLKKVLNKPNSVRSRIVTL